jgi:hypothetical protein
MEPHVSIVKHCSSFYRKYVAIWQKTAWQLLRAVDPTLGMKAYLYRFFAFDANYIFMANVIQPPSAAQRPRKNSG